MRFGLCLWEFSANKREYFGDILGIYAWVSLHFLFSYSLCYLCRQASLLGCQDSSGQFLWRVPSLLSSECHCLALTAINFLLSLSLFHLLVHISNLSTTVLPGTASFSSSISTTASFDISTIGNPEKHPVHFEEYIQVCILTDMAAKATLQLKICDYVTFLKWWGWF